MKINCIERLFFFAFLLIISNVVFGGVIKGKVLDSLTGEPLIGATVQIESGGKKLTTAVNLDGSYIFRNVPLGKYDLKIKLVGYTTSKEYEVVVTGDKEVVILNTLLNSVSNELSEVKVTTNANKETDRAVRNIEKNSEVLQNILSQKSIELLPDVTVANALQRVSGVTIQRSSSGEGRYAIIRGIDQRYNNVLVNGIKIPSPDDKYRFVPMDIFPSDMLERLEIIKSLTPAMEGDAIGGTLNLVMKNAPDQFLLTANGALGYSTLFSDRPFSSFDHSGINKQSPAEIHGNDYAATQNDFTRSNLNYTDKTTPLNRTLGITIGDRFLNKKLGVILSASYQDFYRGSNSDVFIPNAQPDPGNKPAFTDLYLRKYSTQTNRIGLHNKFDYIFNNRNKISLYNLYLHQNEYQTRYTVDSVLAIQRTGPGSGNVTISNRSRWQSQNIYSSTLQGDHKLSKGVELNWSATYSLAKSAVPDMAEYNVDHAVVKNAVSGKIDTTDGTGNNVGINGLHTQKISHIWQRNSDQDIAGYLNLKYTTEIAKHDIEFSVGGLYRYKTRDNYYNEYSLVPILSNGAAQVFTSINTAQYSFNAIDNSKGTITTQTGNNYTVHEKIGAGYLQAKIMLTSKLQLLGGVRIENTNQDYNTALGVTNDSRYGSIKYTDVLPSVHFKYAINSLQNLRLSYFKSISRPGFYEITPYSIPGEQFTEIGNPYLKHVRADNLDMRYELFPGGADQVLLGGFYKKLQDPIENFIVRDGGPSAQFLKPQNTNSATNYGFELVATKYAGMFGLSLNYTYTHSAVTTDKNYYYRDIATAQITTKIVSQTRPLQGQANHIGNVSFLYKNPNIGLDFQLAFVYTGERISLVSPYAGLDYWQRPYSQIDLSFEQRLIKKLSFYAKVNNLTNAANKVYIKQPNLIGFFPDQDKSDKILVQKDVYEISFLGGFRYKF